MHDFLMIILGVAIGVIIGIGLITLLTANKPEDIENEKAEMYKQGYDKGFKDGCDYQSKLN